MKMLIIDVEEKLDIVKIFDKVKNIENVMIEYIKTDDEIKISKIKDILRIENSDKINEKQIELKNINVDPIDELTQIYSKRLENSSNLKEKDASINKKTLKQMTKSLPHYFKSQYIDDEKYVYQINVNGKKPFNLYLKIYNNECEVCDGIDDNYNIEINAKDEVWEKVLKGSITTQKAFMMGDLKVKGNFVLLSKFDKLFDKQK